MQYFVKSLSLWEQNKRVNEVMITSHSRSINKDSDWLLLRIACLSVMVMCTHTHTHHRVDGDEWLTWRYNLARSKASSIDQRMVCMWLFLYCIDGGEGEEEQRRAVELWTRDVMSIPLLLDEASRDMRRKRKGEKGNYLFSSGEWGNSWVFRHSCL